MILVSAVLVLVALVLLLYGVIASDGVFEIWLSIAASVAAGLLLVWGVLQQRRRLAASSPASSTTDPAAPADAPVPPAPASDAEFTRPEGADALPPPAGVTAQELVAAHDSEPVISVEPAAEPATEPEAASATPAAAPAVELAAATPPVAAAVPDLEATSPLTIDATSVLVLAGRPRYHVPGCRFLDGRDDIEVMSLDDAQAQGYTPCSVCRA